MDEEGDLFVQINKAPLFWDFQIMRANGMGAELIFRSKSSGPLSFTTKFTMKQNGRLAIGENGDLMTITDDGKVGFVKVNHLIHSR